MLMSVMGHVLGACHSLLNDHHVPEANKRLSCSTIIKSPKWSLPPVLFTSSIPLLVLDRATHALPEAVPGFCLMLY